MSCLAVRTRDKVANQVAGTTHESFSDLEAAWLSAFMYVETFYNPVRLHQTLGDKSSDQFEAEYAPVLAA